MVGTAPLDTAVGGPVHAFDVEVEHGEVLVVCGRRAGVLNVLYLAENVPAVADADQRPSTREIELKAARIVHIELEEPRSDADQWSSTQDPKASGIVRIELEELCSQEER